MQSFGNNQSTMGDSIEFQKKKKKIRNNNKSEKFVHASMRAYMHHYIQCMMLTSVAANERITHKHSTAFAIYLHPHRCVVCLVNSLVLT